MKGYLLDANLLIALLWPAHERHGRAAKWFARHRGHGSATCPFTETGFVRIVSNPASSRDAVQPREAIQLLRANTAAKDHQFWPDELPRVAAVAFAGLRLLGHQPVHSRLKPPEGSSSLRPIRMMKAATTSLSILAGAVFLTGLTGGRADNEDARQRFLDQHCFECHDTDSKKGGLDLSTLAFHPADPTNFARWVKVYDRVSQGEMPPKKKPRPEPGELQGFTRALSASLMDAEGRRVAAEGRATQRRLNRYEYENALRDLLHAPWLQIRDTLPEDGERYRFNKIGEALDVSHVQMARYLAAADGALRAAMAPSAARPETRVTRCYARDQRSFTGPMKFTVFNTAPERATFPALGTRGQPDVRRGEAPLTAGPEHPDVRELEGVGVVASAYEPIEPKFNTFMAPVAGHYRLRLNALSVWVGPGQSNRWYIPNLDDISRGHRSEPLTLYAEKPPRLLRWLGKFDVTPDPSVHELEVWLLPGETIRPDACRLFRSRPGPSRWQNPLAEKSGQPGVVFRWLEVEGPIYDQWPPAGHKLLFADLPLVDKPVPPQTTTAGTNRFGLRRFTPLPGVEVISKNPRGDAERLLSNFAQHAYRRPVGRKELRRFLPVITGALAKGSSFTDSMLAGYTAVLCSPEFIYVEE
ncbi:MAG: DUF1587 domain-containing protein, partial [Verrucomicrobia bacterium]|nr:DUF1587 domain-containing protein [Verrucomicrobiota bacterium]